LDDPDRIFSSHLSVARTAITMPFVATTGVLESFRFFLTETLPSELTDMQPFVSTVMRDTLKRV
jgi:hypothetical protein